MDGIINDRLKYTIVLGNGFDLDLGLKTRYSDFIDSVEWKDMYKKRSEELHQFSLIQFLNGKRYTDEWFDIESALLDYVSHRQDGSFAKNPKVDIEDYRILCKTLVSYLNNQINKDLTDMEQSCAVKVLKTLSGQLGWYDRKLYSFNFTPIELYNRIFSSGRELETNYVHGMISNNSIIIGVETKDINKIAPGYTFLIKSNNNSYRSSSLSSDLLRSQEVIFFGHSLNEMDMGYFEEYFEMMEQNTDVERRLTIVTYNDASRQQILDNLRRSGISVQKLFTHSTFDIIKTKKIEERNAEECRSFEEFLNRL
ncbi:MAG: hypothetical protein J6O54_07285 [Prevotella sp.]|nr:hypothetical protein [Prevotella sp.]MBO6187047.1 hypothetical protein [Prevotella sp.]